MVKKITMNLNSSRASSPDCIPVVDLKNYEPELSYILAEIFNMCLKESCFPDCWKVSLVVPVFKNVGERSAAKNYCPVNLLSVASKVFEKLVNIRIVDQGFWQFGMQVFFTNVGLMEFHVRCLAVFLLFSVVGGLGWF